MTAAASYRLPAVRLLLNGQPLAGVCDVRISSTDCNSANTFSAVIALGPDSSADASFWAAASFLSADVQLSLDGGQSFTSLIKGMIDTIALDLTSNDVRIGGRDFTALLLEANTQETFANRTASEIATILANRHGLTPMVVPTDTPIGRFYQSDHEAVTLNTLSHATTEWDLLTSVARKEGYETFIVGEVLYFQPTRSPSDIQAFISRDEVVELILDRALVLAREVTVVVKSWNSQQQLSFSVQASGTLDTSGAVSTTVQPPTQYILVRPNLTPGSATDLAIRYLSEITRHERSIEFLMPGELTLTPRCVIALTGTDTDFDQSYYVRSVDRMVSSRTGFLQRVRAESSSPRTISVFNYVS